MQKLFFLCVFIIGCSPSGKDKIQIPNLSDDFYAVALNQINQKLRSSPDNVKLLEQKVFYCRQLGWPEECISALDMLKKEEGMNNQLVRAYIQYHTRHKHYSKLLDIFDQYGSRYQLKEELPYLYIESLVQSGHFIRAKQELRWYLKAHQSVEDIRFASTQYLAMSDTALATYNLSKLYRMDPKDPLAWHYGRLLFELGYANEALHVVKDHIAEGAPSEQRPLVYSKMLAALGKYREAREVIKPFLSMDTVAYTLADYYRAEMLWDSAFTVLSSVVQRDSSNRKAIWKTGRLLEDRGLLYSSLEWFNYLLKLNENDTIVTKKIELVQRKIAYLQRLKFEREKLPELELQPLKINN